MIGPGSKSKRATQFRALCNLITGQVADAGSDKWSPQDWAMFVGKAEAEGVAGLAYWSTTQNPSLLAIPAYVRTRLAERYYADAAHNALLFDELDKLLSAFSQAGVPVIVLKGAALAREVYPDQALRPMNDLDLLIRISQLRIAMRTVQSCGFHILKSTYHIVYQGGPRQSVIVELHWSLIGSLIGQAEEYLERLWECALPLNADNPLMYRMHPVDCILYLCAHLIWQHPQEHARLLWYYDLYQLIQRYRAELNWASLVDNALQAGLAQPLYQALDGVAKRFGAQHPHGFLETLAERAPAAREISTVGQPYELRMQRWLRRATGMLPFGLRLRIWLGLLLPNPTYMRWRYRPRSGWLLPAYYPLRWWLLLRDGLAGWMK